VSPPLRVAFGNIAGRWSNRLALPPAEHLFGVSQLGEVFERFCSAVAAQDREEVPSLFLEDADIAMVT
jgi:hypothetical protein